MIRDGIVLWLSIASWEEIAEEASLDRESPGDVSLVPWMAKGDLS